jgi:hypothetical protein
MLEAEAMPESEAAATTTGDDSLAEAGVGLGAAAVVHPGYTLSFFFKPNLKPDLNCSNQSVVCVYITDVSYRKKSLKNAGPPFWANK